MRKNKSGRISKIKDVQEKVLSLRNANLSFSEIGDTLNISRQLAFYHYSIAKKKQSLDKEL